MQSRSVSDTTALDAGRNPSWLGCLSIPRKRCLALALAPIYLLIKARHVQQQPPMAVLHIFVRIECRNYKSSKHISIFRLVLPVIILHFLIS